MALNAKPLILGHDNRLLVPLGIPSATDTAAGYSVANIIDLRPYTWWQAASVGTKYITADSGAEKDADALGIIGHNLHSGGAVVSVEYSATGAWAGEEVVAVVGFTPASDKAFIKTFTSAGARYWRIKIVSPTVAPRIAVAVLGERMDFERYPAGPFDPAPEKLNAVAARSKHGHMIGAVLSNIGISINANWKMLTPSWVANTFRPVWDDHLSQLKPFFFAWDAVNHATDVFFVTLPAEFTLNMPYDPYRRSLALTMEGIKETADAPDAAGLFALEGTELFTWED